MRGRAGCGSGFASAAGLKKAELAGSAAGAGALAVAAALPANADPQVRDVARRFALVATAGELARAWGVLPWPEGEAERGARAMFAAWLARRTGGAGAAEEAWTALLATLV